MSGSTMYDLIVLAPFGVYHTGQLVTDPTQVATILANPTQSRSVVKVGVSGQMSPSSTGTGGATVSGGGTTLAPSGTYLSGASEVGSSIVLSYSNGTTQTLPNTVMTAAELAALQQVAGIATSQQADEAAIATLQQQHATDVSAIAALQASGTGTGTSLTSTQTANIAAVPGIANRQTADEATISTQGSAVAAQGTRLTADEATISTQGSTVATNASAVGSLGSRLTGDEATASTQGSAQTALASRLTADETILSGKANISAYVRTPYTASGTLATTDSLSRISSSSAVTMTLANGSVDNHAQLIANIGAGAASIVGTFYGTAQTYTLPGLSAGTSSTGSLGSSITVRYQADLISYIVE